MPSIDLMAKAVAVQGASKIIDPDVRATLDKYHAQLGEQCDGSGEITAVMMMDGLSYAVATCRDEARSDLRAILKRLVDVIFDTAEERFPGAPVVLH